jgi:hypothetical protein
VVDTNWTSYVHGFMKIVQFSAVTKGQSVGFTVPKPASFLAIRSQVYPGSDWTTDTLVLFRCSGSSRQLRLLLCKLVHLIANVHWIDLHVRPDRTIFCFCGSALSTLFCSTLYYPHLLLLVHFFTELYRTLNSFRSWQFRMSPLIYATYNGYFIFVW